MLQSLLFLSLAIVVLILTIHYTNKPFHIDEKFHCSYESTLEYPSDYPSNCRLHYCLADKSGYVSPDMLMGRRYGRVNIPIKRRVEAY